MARPAAAPPARLSSCWCAASARAGGGLRKGPRPGGWQRRWSGVSGCGLVLGWTQDPAFVCGRVEDAAFASGSRRERRSVRPRARVDEASWVPFALGRREVLPSRGPFHAKEESLPAPSPRGRTHEEPWPQDAEKKNRASPTSPSQTPRPRAAPRSAAGRGPFRRPTPAKAEAAQRRAQTPAANAPAGRDPLEAAQQPVTQAQDSSRTRCTTGKGRPKASVVWVRRVRKPCDV